MICGLMGKKLGMTQIFDKDGNAIPVTVLEAGPCTVMGLMESPHKKITLGFELLKEKRVKKPQLGSFKKMDVQPLRYIKEFESNDNKDYSIGQQIKADIFKPGDYVDVTGVSKGKGFQGGVKRWHWAGGPAAHGSMHHRRVGSISASSDPSRVFRGAHMPGHMGAAKVTVQGLRVMTVNAENNTLVVSGAVPGHRQALLSINLSKKKAFRSLEEKSVAHKKSRNPMKQSKKAAKVVKSKP